MTKYLLSPFGQIDLALLNEDYIAVVESNENKISIDINFKKTTIEKSEMDKIKNFFESISLFDDMNIGLIKKIFNDTNVNIVKDYIDFHIEALEKEKLGKLIDYHNKEISLEKQLLDKLTLERVGIYPDRKYNTDYFAIFDYTFKGNVYVDGIRTITDQIIAIKTDINGNSADLTWES